MIFASTSLKNDDPTPYVLVQDPRRRFTRQDAMSMGYAEDPVVVYDPRPQFLQVRAHRANPILERFREHTSGTDLFAHSSEFLFQLARHWERWQSPRIGTFPLEYTDPSGPGPLDEALENGEDMVFYDIEDIISELCEHEPGTAKAREESDLVQDILVHATRVLDRVLESHRHEG